MSMGLWMPLCLLAVHGAREIVAPRFPAPRSKVWLALGLGLAALSNGLVWLAVLLGVLGRSPELFYSSAEMAALGWLAGRPPGEVVLASPDTSLLVPVWSDARVIYAHTFETVDAERQRQLVLDFFAGRVAPQPVLDEQGVDWVVYGPREAALGRLPALPGWRVVFQQEDVAVYGR
jgi:hypothetical protein